MEGLPSVCFRNPVSAEGSKKSGNESFWPCVRIFAPCLKSANTWGEPLGSAPESIPAAPCMCFPFCWQKFLKHAPSCGDSGSSYILTTLAVPGRHISETCPITWRFRLIRYLNPSPSFGDSGSSYILNTPPDLASPVHHHHHHHHIQTRSLIYLK